MAMVQETRSFLRELIRDDLSVRNFIRSDFAMLNTRLKKLADGVTPEDPAQKRTARMFFWGVMSCLLSGIFSACVALGWSEGEPLDEAMALINETTVDELAWKGQFVRWLPIYFGGFLAILIFMGGEMIRSGDWRNYFQPKTGRDRLIASSMSCGRWF